MAGTTWSLAMAAFFGFSQLASRKGLAGIAVDQGTFIMIAVSTALMAGPFLWLGGPALLAAAPPAGLLYFVLAGVIHFVGGFTLMNLSISQIGAARTGSLIASTPLFATLLAAATLGEPLTLPLLAGVTIVVAGVLLIASRPGPARGSATLAPRPFPAPGAAALVEAGGGGNGAAPSPRSAARRARLHALAPAFGLLAAMSWGFTPVLIKKGLASLPQPLVGLTLAMACAGATYAALLAARGRLRPLFAALGQPPARWQVASGALVGLGTLARWMALSFTTAAMVTTLSRASLLITVGLGGKLLGRELEPVTSRVRWGALLIVIGGVMVVFYGR